MFAVTAQFFDGNVEFTDEFDTDSIVTIGEGYDGLTFDTLTPIADLQNWIESAAYTPDAADGGATAIACDIFMIDDGDERFWIYMDDDPIESGMTLELGWYMPVVGRVSALPALGEAVEAMAELTSSVSGETALAEAVEAEQETMPAVAGDVRTGPAVSGVMVLRRKVDALPEAG